MGQQRIPISETISIVVDTWINTPTVIYAFCETSDLLQTASQLPCWCPYMWGQRWLVPIVRMVDILIEIFLEQSGSCDFLLCLLWVITPSLPDEIFALFLAMRACRWVAVCCHRKVVDVETMEEFVQFPLFPQCFPRRGCVRRYDRFFSLTWKMWRERPPIPVKSTISTTFSLFFPIISPFYFPLFPLQACQNTSLPLLLSIFSTWLACVRHCFPPKPIFELDN